MAQVKDLLKSLRWLRRSLLKVQYRGLPIIPLSIILFFVGMAIFAPWIAPRDPLETNLPNKLIPPFWQEGGSMEYPLGTDHLGRDVWSRIVFGSRMSLLVAVLVIIIGGMGGTFIGISSGYIGGRLDAILMRFTDGALAFPMILIALILAVTLGPSLQNVVLAISFVIWAFFARTVRGEVLSLKTRDFVTLARIAGCSRLRIMLQHLFPNILNTAVVMLTLQIGHIILFEASLSFLGAGIPPPTPVWGSMVATGRGYMTIAWWMATLPGLCILLLVLAFNLIGDWLREVLDPKMRQFAGGGV